MRATSNGAHGSEFPPRRHRRRGSGSRRRSGFRHRELGRAETPPSPGRQRAAGSAVRRVRSRSSADATERDDRTHDVFNRIVGHVLKGQGSGGSDLNLGDLAYDCASNVASRKL